jgi:hypothetical protein
MSESNNGRWIIMVLVLIAGLISSCVRWEKDPPAVYGADPKALEIPAITFAVVPF